MKARATGLGFAKGVGNRRSRNYRVCVSKRDASLFFGGKGHTDTKAQRELFGRQAAEEANHHFLAIREIRAESVKAVERHGRSTRLRSSTVRCAGIDRRRTQKVAVTHSSRRKKGTISVYPRDVRNQKSSLVSFLFLLLLGQRRQWCCR